MPRQVSLSNAEGSCSGQSDLFITAPLVPGQKRRCHRVMVCKGTRGGDSPRPYSQQTPIRTSPSCCLGLIGNGQHNSKNRLLSFLPHERSHGIMRIPENLCMLLPNALKMRATKNTAIYWHRDGALRCCCDPRCLTSQGLIARSSSVKTCKISMLHRSLFSHCFWCFSFSV